MSPSVLVTGSRGALGTELVTALRSAGWTVIPTSRDGDHALDVTRALDVDRLVRRLAPSAVVHFAAALPGSDEQTLEAVNVRGTAAVADACARIGARLVFASSAAVYGTHNSAASREDSVPAPATPYGRSKARAEEEIDLRGDRISALSLRIFNVTGPGFPGSLPCRILRADAEHPVEVRNPDGFVRDYIRTEDVARAVVAALGSDALPGHTRVNVGTGVPTSTRSLLQRLSAIRPPAVREVPGADDRVWADTELSRRILGVDAPSSIDADWFPGLG